MRILPVGLSGDFRKFWAGQTISNFGTSVTAFAVPLLIYRLTGSPINLALAIAASTLPYLLFGLVIGAWVDRVDRRRLMIAVDIARALVIASIPLLGELGRLPVWWIYGVGFLSSTLSICFDASEFAAIPNLVGPEDLVRANGRIQASYAAANVAGPLAAGLLASLVPVHLVLVCDALSFLVSALSLALVRVDFSAPRREARQALLRQIREGLEHVFRHPVLRNISLMMALVNVVASTAPAQLVLLAVRHLRATDVQLGMLYSAGSAGTVGLGLTAGWLSRRLRFRTVALGALVLDGFLIVLLAITPWYWLALPLWAMISGLGVLFNINTGSLRQAMVPNQLLGRVVSVAQVTAWSAIPLGTALGGLAIAWTGNIALVYAGVGVLTMAIPIVFRFTALGHAERYLPGGDSAVASWRRLPREHERPHEVTKRS